MSEHRYLAIDLGAESGRVMAGVLQDGTLSLEEMHRFPNIPIQQDGSLIWNIEALQSAIREGLAKAARTGHSFDSVSCDSWGVDYVLYDVDGRRMDPVFHYRDARTERGVKAVFERMNWEAIFAESGIQFMPLNALFQLGAEVPERLASARSFHGIGDAINHWLGGRPVVELSMVSTFQLYHPVRKQWSDKLVEAAGLRADQLPEIVHPGTPIGELSGDMRQATGLAPMRIVASCSHDTGAAVAAVPAASGTWAYLSSGTWSLMGAELRDPIINAQSLELNYTNEIGYGESIRLLKNIIGMWLMQECRRAWEAEGQAMDYDALIRLAAEAPAFRSLIHPAHPRFVPPGGMPERIRAYCRETGQPEPTTPGETVRCILESLALLYRQTLRDLEAMTGQSIEVLHIVGGGSRNRLLNQWTANALHRKVIAGPVEATAIGNMLIQALALGHLPSLAAAREVVRSSFPTETYTPTDADSWDQAFTRFGRLSAG